MMINGPASESVRGAMHLRYLDQSREAYDLRFELTAAAQEADAESASIEALVRGVNQV